MAFKMIRNCKITLSNNIFQNNSAYIKGGSLYFDYVEGDILFYGNTFEENTAKEYGDIYLGCRHSTVLFKEN
jgi:hypothetical protein